MLGAPATTTKLGMVLQIWMLNAPVATQPNPARRANVVLERINNASLPAGIPHACPAASQARLNWAARRAFSSSTSAARTRDDTTSTQAQTKPLMTLKYFVNDFACCRAVARLQNRSKASTTKAVRMRHAAGPSGSLGLSLPL